MFSSPGFSKPVHQYGEPFGDEAGVLDAETPAVTLADEDWAGPGFIKTYQEPDVAS
jgi:hypothetical protein